MLRRLFLKAAMQLQKEAANDPACLVCKTGSTLFVTNYLVVSESQTDLSPVVMSNMKIAVCPVCGNLSAVTPTTPV